MNARDWFYRTSFHASANEEPHGCTIAEYKSPEGTTRSVIVAHEQVPAPTITKGDRVFTLVKPNA